ncbi:MAG TPA: tetratricopeptide repeat protein, partial [Flavobacteriales bacterium]|nr:tetratricopeptide repeat protein [Flavobacteriales bacterium]
MEQAIPARTLPEKVQQELNALKKCPPSGTMERFSALLRSFVELDRNEQRICADDLHSWAERHANAHPVKLVCARVCQVVALVYSDRFGPALEQALDAQRAFEKEGEARGGAICLVGIGACYRALGNTDLALRSLWEAYHELEKTELFAHFRMVSAYQIAGIYLDLKQHEEAIPLFSSTHDLAVKEGNQRLLTYSLQGLGKAYLLKGELDRAGEYLKQAVAAAEVTNNPNTVSGALTSLAEMRLDTGDLQAAEQLELQALALREAHGYIAGAATNCICLGRVYVRLGRSGEAIALLHKGLALAEPRGLKVKVYQIHLLLSEIHQVAGDAAKSLFHYQRFHAVQTEVEVEDGAEKVKNLHVVFAAEQTRKENA